MGATIFNPQDADSTVHTTEWVNEHPVPESTDVLIIGAGIIGLTTAFRLVQAGRTVTLLDPAPASQATRAAAGMLAPASEIQYRQEPLVPLMRDAAALYADLAEQVAEVSGQKVGLRNTTTYVCAFDAADKASLDDMQTYQQEFGLDAQRITTRAARKTEPVLSPGISGAIEIPGDHQINPRWFASALLTYLADSVFAVRAREVLVSEDDGIKKVTGVRWTASQASTNPEQDGATDTATSGTITAQQVIIANGLGALDLEGVPELKNLPLRPVHGDVIRLRIPENQRPFLNSTIRGVVRGNPVYMVPREDNTLVIGASAREDSMAGINAGGVYQLLRDAHDLVPSVTELEIYEIISRARPGSPDDIPFVGSLRAENGTPIEHLTIANGFFRHGILLSARASELISHLLTDELTDQDRQDLFHCDPNRFTRTLVQAS